MSQYYDNFNGATVGAGHPDFSVLWGALGISVEATSILPDSDAHLLISHSTGSFVRNAVAWNKGATSGATTVRALVEFMTHGVITGSISGAMLSATGTTSTRTGYVQWYRTGYDLSRYDNGSDSTVGGGATGGTAGEVVQRYVEIYRNADVIEVRAWDYDGGVRPAVADISYTDPSPLPVAGAFGLSHLSNGSATDPNMRVYEVLAATNGDDLPEGGLYPYVFTDHGVADPNSFMASANFGSTQQIDIGIVNDFDPEKVVVDWQAVSDQQLWRDDVNTIAAVTPTTEEDTTDTATLSYRVTETGETGTFDVTVNLTSDGADVTPSAFTFTDQTGVSLSTVVESNAITVAGVDAGENIPVTISGGEYAVDTGAGFGGYTSTGTNVQLGDQIKVRHTSSSSNSTETNTTLTVGGVSDTFTSTTLAADPPAAITSVNVPAADSYGIGDPFSFTVNWDEAVTVTGVPRLPVNLTTGTVYADYASGSDTTAIIFSYTVQEGDNDADGITLGNIELNGGTIKDASTNNATLTLAGVENTAGVIVDGVRPVITVTGENPYNITVGETYTDPGATASDNQDGSLGSVTGTGTVDTNTEGQYTRTYPGAGVVDSAGNVALNATRTVNVNAAPNPDDWPFGKRIKYAVTKSWKWGKRHPKTGMRVRIYDE